MPKRAVCIHGHFYQPPREDPITGELPKEEGAAPYLNWNEKIYAQCYKPNVELGNFKRISFDLGPTLTNWLVNYDSATFSKIVAQERKTFLTNGVGNGMAMAYNHTILPLASSYDKKIQIRWGIEDFKYRFGHAPTGMWLPEAAVDYETLELLVDAGIEFTILAPWQAAEYNIDVTQPYWVALKNNRRIAVFFYQEELSMRVSFDPGATSNGDAFIHQYLTPQFSSNGYHPHDEIMIIASDGELYGHHQPFRDKFLSYVTNWCKSHPDEVEVTYPGLWLRSNPPTSYVKIRENTSWSCHHGVARWKEACPCGPNGDWKSKLFSAMKAIASLVDEQYLKAVSPYTRDPWELMGRYIEVMHGELPASEWIFRVLRTNLDTAEKLKIERLLGAQLNKQKMFTSCGWFFDDFDRIEPKIVITAAAQAVWLVKQACGIDLIPQAIELFAGVHSWRTNLRGDSVFVQQLNQLRFEQLTLPFNQPEQLPLL